MKSIRLWLKLDENFPMFRRLDWEVVETSLEDVLERGIHPWMENQQPHDMTEAFLNQLNEGMSMPSRLSEYRFSHKVDACNYSPYVSKSGFERTLERVQSCVLFCDPSLDFPQLLGVAMEKLRQDWSHGLALRLAERLNPSFQELRRFLKAKDKTVKLQGHGDVSNFNLGTILSLEDFANHERLLIDDAISPLNFRAVSFLDSVTDENGRLRLAASIDHVTVTHRPTGEFPTPVIFQAERQGSNWRVRPNIGGSRSARLAAQDVARKWRRDHGELCFRVRTEDLVHMVDSGDFAATFPGLRYTLGQYSPKVSGSVAKSKVPIYKLGGYPRQGWSGERLKSVLREYRASTTGVKKVLVAKLAKLGATEYEAQRRFLDIYFAENRFVRVARDIKYGEALPVLCGDDSLRGLVLHLYALRHLRGNAVVDPSHTNDSCTVEDLAQALITDRVTLTGGLIQVA